MLPLLALAQGCSAERAAEILTFADGDSELALRSGEGLSSTLTGLEQLIAAALQADGLAIVRTAAAARQLPGGADLVGAALLRLAAKANREEAEEFLNAAAALLVADDRRALLHLDAESVLVGTLARIAVGRGAR
jgi:hypothetical protein